MGVDRFQFLHDDILKKCLLLFMYINVYRANQAPILLLVQQSLQKLHQLPPKLIYIRSKRTGTRIYVIDGCRYSV